MHVKTGNPQTYFFFLFAIEENEKYTVILYINPKQYYQYVIFYMKYNFSI